jgi:hypothetical protein
MSNRPVVCAILTSLAVSGSGCGLVMGGGSRQVVRATSSPDGALVTTSPETAETRTPAALNLERKNSYVLTFTKEGYAPAKAELQRSTRAGIVVADVLLTGLIGVVVDAATGSWYKLSPEVVTVALEKVADVPGPDRIEVTVRTGGKSHDRLDVTATVPVEVSVEGK